ncbi:hypothetical protein [Pontibacter flavimaris]|uniref:STAS/SEC14 domain-containing protein n=1 Tax=Pontibacter flavimaris TaxID=1797110 RepID=A0A1Q5PFX4_9BACT|nr:hypothetical protein [Pontibacter flavimaris]OKL41117.1 hypothetical protein A3841_14935 [Pontibacter flavimaris]
MVLASTPFHHIEYYAAHNVIVSQWYGRCTSQEYRNTLLQFLHLVDEMHTPYAIADRRLLAAISLEDARWTLQEFLEGFRRLPLKRFAFINSFDPVAQKQLQYFMNTNKIEPFPFEVAVFEDLTSAYEWLVAATEGNHFPAA